MNKPVIAIVVLTVLAILALAYYSFGPPAEHRALGRLNPASLKPTAVADTARARHGTSLVAYHNRDSREDYYTVAFPQAWQVDAGSAPGSYSASFEGGTCTVGLMDVPDNTTLELYVLSQEEPRLKQTDPGYERLSYLKLQVNGSAAYQLVYGEAIDNVPVEVQRTYIAGPDMAAVVSITADRSDFGRVEHEATSVLNSFRWENP